MSKRFLAVILMMILTISAFAQESDAVSKSNSHRELTQQEMKFKETVLDKKNINPADEWAMEKLWKGYLAMGISGAVVGGGLLLTGGIVMAVTTANVYNGIDSYGDYSLASNYKRWYRDQYNKTPTSYYSTTGDSSYVYDPMYAYYERLYWHGQSALIGMIVGAAIGSVLMTAGCIITPVLCAVGFSRMAKTASIYRKTTGQRLMSFIQRTSFGGGYDWESKEVNVTMAIKL